jgi:hypothetical protein
MGRDASIQNKLKFYHLSEEKFNFATYSATYFIYFAHKAIKNPIYMRILMVGTTGIEPVTPAISMHQRYCHRLLSGSPPVRPY